MHLNHQTQNIKTFLTTKGISPPKIIIILSSPTKHCDPFTDTEEQKKNKRHTHTRKENLANNRRRYDLKSNANRRADKISASDYARTPRRGQDYTIAVGRRRLNQQQLNTTKAPAQQVHIYSTICETRIYNNENVYNISNNMCF